MHFHCTKVHTEVYHEVWTYGRKKDMTNIKLPFFKSPEHVIYIRYSKQLDYLLPPFDTRHFYDNDVKRGNIEVTWIKRDQLDVTCFFISLFTAQHVSDVNTSILRSLRLICGISSWDVLLLYDVCWCYCVVRLGWCGILMQAEALVPQPA